MRAKVRRWDAHSTDDPLSGLVNLFDLWMVFSIALLLALVAAVHLPEHASQGDQAGDKNAPAGAPSQDRNPLDNFRVSHEKLTGEGHRLGTAYRLKNGEVVYVPD